jgi:hypothetical protein
VHEKKSLITKISQFEKRGVKPNFCYFYSKYDPMEIAGKIKLLDETKTFGNNGFRKREVVVTTEEQYPQHIMVEFVQDKCELLNAFQVGQNVKIGINLRGREWVNPQGETKYFNAIQGWRIEAIDQSQASNEAPPMPPPTSFEPASDSPNEVEDDLPF